MSEIQHTQSAVEKQIINMCNTALEDLNKGCARVMVQEWIGGVYISLSQLGFLGGGIWSYGVPRQGEYLNVTDDVYVVIAAVERLVAQTPAVAA